MRELGLDEKDNEVFGEDVVVRIAAKKNIQNVRLEIDALRPLGSKLEFLQQNTSSKFLGSITKGMDQSFVVLRRTFSNVAARYEHPVSGTEGGRSIRIDRDATIFPENPSVAISADIGQTYHFEITVFHDGGPERASFAVQLIKWQIFPQSLMLDLENIRTIMD